MAVTTIQIRAGPLLPHFATTSESDGSECRVLIAVDEADDFANFRETATKRNSLVDRLKAIELPDVDDVADDLESYPETKKRAEEIGAKIEIAEEAVGE
ncbi:hypothetical protein [Halorubrum tibetense]|uniref:Uncharacterized protein n=1 Tax=Halorubrum tibetense TaxID=175631 RepID=A0ABD5S857_9EURY